jgi:hypothetical protein
LKYPLREAHRHDAGHDVMNTNAVHEIFGVLPADSVAYRCSPKGSGRKTKNPLMAAHLRWGEAMNNREWGWCVAMTHHASGEPLPPSLRDPRIRRAYRYLEGARDDQMAQAHALKASPNCMATRRVLQGLLCARDISLEGIASLLELDAEEVRLFEALFFNVRERGDAFRASVLFPETRIGAVVEAELNYDEADLMLMRVGRDYGWREVARLAGLHTMEDEAESTEDALADMEKTMAANARMLARAGHLNREDSPGIRHGKTLMMRPKPEAMRQQVDDDKVGLGSFGMKAPVLEHFRRIRDTDTQYHLQLRRQERRRVETQAADGNEASSMT